MLVYAWGLFSEYQSSQDSLSEIEDTAKFNEQFTNYDRDDVQGYELLTLTYKVIDYNYRKSNSEGSQNDDKYPSITMIIKLGDEDTRKNKLTKDGVLRLFNKSGNLTYTQSNTINQLETVTSFALETEQRYGGADVATRIAKSIDSIFLTDTQLAYNRNQGISDDESWNNAIKKFNSYSTMQKVNNKTELDAEKIRVYKYYEYVQFKRAIFECESVGYDEANTGRVISIVFNFTGDIY